MPQFAYGTGDNGYRYIPNTLLGILLLPMHLHIEINAHALITFLMVVRSHTFNDQTTFLPWLLGSQVCEKTFRTARNMSSTFSTVL